MTIRRDARAAEQSWVSVQVLTSETLCATCFEGFGSLLQAAATGVPARPLGAPHAVETATPSGDACDLCRAHLTGDSFAVELVPEQREMIRRDLFRFDARLRQYRLCGGCLAWARSVAYDESAVLNRSFRDGLGLASDWRPTHARDACTAFLLPCDDDEVELYTRQSGRSYRRAPRRTGIGAGPPGEALFIGAGVTRQASAVVEHLTPEERSRVIVVARFETLADAREALAAGAAEMLVSPLLPRHVSGAFQRACEREAGQKPTRTADGLPMLQPGPDRPGRPGQLLAISAARHTTMEKAWILRRFLRGDDRVGFAQGDGLEAQVFCPDAHVDIVRGRITHLFGDRTTIRSVGRSAAALQKTA
ncbi:MAG: hypothetical protein C0506_01455 [Anaerolinea sp.]|nr:hypothetical protein [Anaerolinea sp.]